MRIVVYKDSLSTGRGADAAVKNFAAGLAERGHDVALMERPEFMSRILGPGSKDEGDFDVVVATGSNEIVDMDAAGYFARPRRAKVVLQLHLAPRGFFKWKHPFRNRRIRVAFDKPDAVQLLCSSYKEEFRRIAKEANQDLVVQEAVQQHPAYAKLNSSSVNTHLSHPLLTLPLPLSTLPIRSSTRRRR